MMQYTKALIKTGMAICAASIFSACTSSPSPSGDDFIYENINFGADRDSDFKQGVKDACRTADGDYTKNHELYKQNTSYHVGWEDGRLKCKGKGDEVVQ